MEAVAAITVWVAHIIRPPAECTVFMNEAGAFFYSQNAYMYMKDEYEDMYTNIRYNGSTHRVIHERLFCVNERWQNSFTVQMDMAKKTLTAEQARSKPAPTQLAAVEVQDSLQFVYKSIARWVLLNPPTAPNFVEYYAKYMEANFAVLVDFFKEGIRLAGHQLAITEAGETVVI